jgi:hypothetical protein
MPTKASEATAASEAKRIALEKDLAKSSERYEAHVIASRSFHDAKMHLKKSKRALRKLEAAYRTAKAATVDAIADVDCKRAAAAAFGDELNPEPDNAPTSELYEAQDPAGDYGASWTISSPTGYCELTGVPQYENRRW